MSFFFRNFPFGLETNVEEEEDMEGKRFSNKRKNPKHKHYKILRIA